MGGTPWEFRERYIENSPFFYLDRVETPLLLIHGAEDTASAPFNADQVFVGLRRLLRQNLRDMSEAREPMARCMTGHEHGENVGQMDALIGDISFILSTRCVGR